MVVYVDVYDFGVVVDVDCDFLFEIDVGVRWVVFVYWVFGVE